MRDPSAQTRARPPVGRSGWRRTLAVRRCGGCERLLGLALWPWSGQLVARTHGLCDACFERSGFGTRAPRA